MKTKFIATALCVMLLVAGCESTAITPLPSMVTQIPPTSTPAPVPTAAMSIPTVELPAYVFPESIDPAKQYLFYLHGQIIEDQGIHAVSAKYGEYEYEAILDELQAYGFVIISERRPRDTDTEIYAHKIVEQVTLLLKAMSLQGRLLSWVHPRVPILPQPLPTC